MAVLHAVIGYPPGTQFPIDGQRIVLGRSPDCEVVLDAAAVSRHHAAITRENGRFFIEDLGSRNGTFLNGLRVETRSPLFDGDRLAVCDLTFDFRLTTPSEEIAGTLTGEGLSTAFYIDEDADADRRARSSIMSKLEISTDYGSVRLSAKPEAKLAAMIEISQSLSRTLSVEEIMPRLLDSLFKVFLQADRAFIVMNDSESKRLVPTAMRHRREIDEEVVRISQTIAREAMDKKEAILSADATSDQRFSMAESVADFRIRSMMCAPMLDSEANPLGVIQVDTMNQRARFTEDDLEVLASVASQAGMAIDNARLRSRRSRSRRWLETWSSPIGCSGDSSRRTHQTSPAIISFTSMTQPTRSAAITTTTCRFRTGGWRSSSATSRARAFRRRSSWPSSQVRSVSTWPASPIRPRRSIESTACFLAATGKTDSSRWSLRFSTRRTTT